MILNVSNFAKIKNASISIDSITVIAGLNNTAKTTIGKLVYCLVKSFDSIENNINKERNNRIDKIIDSNIKYDFSASSDILFGLFDNPTLPIYKEFINIEEINKASREEIKNILLKLIDKYDKNKRLSYSTQILDKVSNEIVNIYSIEKEELEKIILNKSFNEEFVGQISNLSIRNRQTTLKFSTTSKDLTIKIKNNKIISIKNELNINANVIMVDNPFIMDKDYNFYEANNHNGDLYDMINKEYDDFIEGAFDEALGNKKIERVIKKLNTILKGDFSFDNSGNELYKENSNSGSIYISNLSTGLKTFVIIRKLINNNILNENSILILDEPEIHLHPEWQLVYAELIVLLQKELNLKVIITTHSPYFLNAIEVFTQTYNLKNTHYYLSKSVENSIEFKEVTNNLEEIYNLLAKPFQTLENIKYGDDMC